MTAPNTFQSAVDGFLIVWYAFSEAPSGIRARLEDPANGWAVLNSAHAL